MSEIPFSVDHNRNTAQMSVNPSSQSMRRSLDRIKTSLKSSMSKERLRHKVRVIVIASSVLTILAPFTTYETMTPLSRGIYWTTQVFICGLVYEIVMLSILYDPVLSKRYNREVRFALGSFIASILSYGGVVTVEYLMRGPIAPEELPLIFVSIFVIGTLISFFSFLLPGIRYHNLVDEADINYDGIPFFGHHPELKGKRLQRITMEDHYAFVVLDDFEVSIHAVMRDLEKWLESYPGLRVHRSHWVAYEAIAGFERKGRNSVLRTKDGMVIPVGGKYLTDVLRIVTEFVSG